MSRFSESGVLTKKDMQNMQSGVARGLELRTAELRQYSHDTLMTLNIPNFFFIVFISLKNYKI